MQQGQQSQSRQQGQQVQGSSPLAIASDSQKPMGFDLYMKPMTLILNQHMPTPQNQLVLSSNALVAVQNQVSIAPQNQIIAAGSNQLSTIPTPNAQSNNRQLN